LRVIEKKMGTVWFRPVVGPGLKITFFGRKLMKVWLTTHGVPPTGGESKPVWMIHQNTLKKKAHHLP